MQNPSLFYLSATDYRAQTQQSALVTPLLDPAVESILLEVMVDIDRYIGAGWIPYDYNQEFIFPRDIDTDATSTPYIPRDVALATRLIADALLLKRSKGILPQEIESESKFNHSYTKRKRSIERDPGFEYWPDEAFSKLDHYRRTGGMFAVSNPDVLGYTRVQ